VLLAEDAAASGEDVLVQLPGPLILTQRSQIDGEVPGRGEGAGWSSPRMRRRQARMSSSNFRAR
jgi:hypothetical protein